MEHSEIILPQESNKNKSEITHINSIDVNLSHQQINGVKLGTFVNCAHFDMHPKITY